MCRLIATFSFLLQFPAFYQPAVAKGDLFFSTANYLSQLVPRHFQRAATDTPLEENSPGHGIRREACHELHSLPGGG